MGGMSSTHLFFFNDTATTEIYTLSLHDALPISVEVAWTLRRPFWGQGLASEGATAAVRSEEHTSELQSHSDLVCRLLLEKKKTQTSKQRVNAEPRTTPFESEQLVTRRGRLTAQA